MNDTGSLVRSNLIKHLETRGVTTEKATELGDWVQGKIREYETVPSVKEAETTRAVLEWRIAHLQAKLDALPKTVKVFALQHADGHWGFDHRMNDASHFLELETDDHGVPVLLKPVDRT